MSPGTVTKLELADKVKTSISDQLQTTSVSGGAKAALGIIVALGITTGVLGFMWDNEPGLFNVVEQTQQTTNDLATNNVIGSATVATTIEIAETLLNKRGGFPTSVH